MSQYPSVPTWYCQIARTIAALSLGPYVFEFTVWCTTAKLTAPATVGPGAQSGDGFQPSPGPHCECVVIVGRDGETAAGAGGAGSHAASTTSRPPAPTAAARRERHGVQPAPTAPSASPLNTS